MSMRWLLVALLLTIVGIAQAADRTSQQAWALSADWLASQDDKIAITRRLHCSKQFEALVRSDLMRAPSDLPLYSSLFSNIQFHGQAETAFNILVFEPLKALQSINNRADINRFSDRHIGIFHRAFLESGRSAQAKKQWRDFTNLALDLHSCVASSLFNNIDLRTELGFGTTSSEVESTEKVPSEYINPPKGTRSLACNTGLPELPKNFEQARLYFHFGSETGHTGDKKGSFIFYSQLERPDRSVRDKQGAAIYWDLERAWQRAFKNGEKASHDRSISEGTFGWADFPDDKLTVMVFWSLKMAPGYVRDPILFNTYSRVSRASSDPFDDIALDPVSNRILVGRLEINPGVRKGVMDGKLKIISRVQGNGPPESRFVEEYALNCLVR